MVTEVLAIHQAEGRAEILENVFYWVDDYSTRISIQQVYKKMLFTSDNHNNHGWKWKRAAHKRVLLWKFAIGRLLVVVLLQHQGILNTL